MILALRSQIIEYLRETFYRHALEYQQWARPGGKNEENCVFLRKRLTIIDLSEDLWSVGTFSPLAPVLGPEQEIWLYVSPSSTVHGSQYDAKYVAFE